jgi:multiple antibiotic resistance protein
MIGTNAFTIFFNLLAVLNPLAVAAIYTTMIDGKTTAQLKTITIQFTLATAIIMLVSLWFGQAFLNIFGLNVPSFECAGGAILIIVGIRLILPKSNKDDMDSASGNVGNSIAIVPLAIPLCAGPGVIAILIATGVSYHTFSQHLLLTGISILLALVCGTTIYFAPNIARKLGPTGMKTVSRVMGLIITAIGFNILSKGFLGLFPGLH